MQERAYLWVGFFLVFIAPYAQAQSSPIKKDSDLAIKRLYQQLEKKHPTNMIDRVNIISADFIGKPYLLGALGEGEEGYYDQRPLYRTDAFDCETYVDTVLALAFGADLPQFKQCINKVRYKNSHVSYVERNHFTDLDWNRNNQKHHFLKDISTQIKNEKNQSVALIAHAMINKSAWYQHMSANSLHLNRNNSKRLAELQQEGRAFKTVRSDIPYIPLTVLFNKEGKANAYLFQQIPDGAIVEIIRPNWDLTQTIGTHLNVSHLGFVFRKNRKLVFRNASSTYHESVELDFISYLREARKSPTIKGINIQRIVYKEPFGCHELSSKK